MGIKDNPLINAQLLIGDVDKLLKKKKKKKTWVSTDGYVRSYSAAGKIQMHHRAIMAKKLGRPLLRSEVVKFKDGNRSNCNPDNLLLAGIDLASIVCPHCHKVFTKS